MYTSQNDKSSNLVLTWEITQTTAQTQTLQTCTSALYYDLKI